MDDSGLPRAAFKSSNFLALILYFLCISEWLACSFVDCCSFIKAESKVSSYLVSSAMFFLNLHFFALFQYQLFSVHHLSLSQQNLINLLNQEENFKQAFLLVGSIPLHHQSSLKVFPDLNYQSHFHMKERRSEVIRGKTLHMTLLSFQ